MRARGGISAHRLTPEGAASGIAEVCEIGCVRRLQNLIDFLIYF